MIWELKGLGYFSASQVSFRKKIHMHASLTKIIANYISEESLINAEYNKTII